MYDFGITSIIRAIGGVSMKKLLIALVLLFLFTTTAEAQITVKKSNAIPPKVIEGAYALFPAESNDEIISLLIVQNEVDYLSDIIPVIGRVDWEVYVIDQRIKAPIMYPDGFMVGCARGYPSPLKVLLFSSPWTSEFLTRGMVGHEIWHIVRWQYIADDDLRQYVEMRFDGKEHLIYYDEPDELFAEDARWLFGTSKSRELEHRATYSLPGQKEKEWILNHILSTWQDRLDYYKFDHEEGKAEIIRSEQIEAQKTVKGDYAGAKAAHNWANQIRQVIGSD